MVDPPVVDLAVCLRRCADVARDLDAARWLTSCLTLLLTPSVEQSAAVDGAVWLLDKCILHCNEKLLICGGLVLTFGFTVFEILWVVGATLVAAHGQAQDLPLRNIKKPS